MGETNYFRATSALCFLALILNIKVEFGACFSSTPRQIQENNGYKYTIDEPTFNWDGFRLNIDYKFSRNLVEDEFVTYAIVSDKDCEGGIISDTELQSSLIEFSRNSVRLSLLLNPENIHGARYVSHYEDFAIIGICARVWINQPLSSSEIEGDTILSAPRNDYIMIQSDLEDLKGITDILDDRTLDWGVDVFRCDKSNKEVVSPLAITNGEKLRLCLKPTTTTRNNNGYIGLIKSFQFARDGDFQKAVATYGTDGVTDVDCPRGSNLCVIETVLSNDFFHSPGEVTATGVIALQYGSEENRKHRSLRSVQVNLRSSISKRSLNAFQNGELVSEKPVEYVVNIKPTNKLYSAEAYPCDNSNKKIIRKTSLKQGEHMKLCIEPDEEARNVGVYITSIESFSYGRANDDKNQQAIDSYGRVSDGNRTQVECAIGAAKCSINSTLEEWFFDQDARMVVTGYAVLQFGDQTQRRRANIVQRDLADLGYAGRSQVDAYFDIIGRNTVVEGKGGLRQWFEDLFDRWELSDNTMTILYIVAAVLFVLICLCCCAGCLFLLCLRKEKREPKERTHLPINIKIQERDYSNSTDLREGSRADYYSSDDSDSSDDSESTDIEDSVRGGPTAIVKSERKNKKKTFEDEIDSTSGGNSDDDLVERNNNISTDSAIPKEDDICFEADEHPGTVAFVAAVQETLVNLGPVPYSPAVYKNIKRQLSDRRFYVCDRDNDDNNGEIDDHFEWREASKRELIDVFWKHYELEKLKGLEL